MNDRQRPSIREAIERRWGIGCPQCGCCHWYTLKTSHVGTHVKRLKQCRHCGHKVVTRERMEDSQ